MKKALRGLRIIFSKKSSVGSALTLFVTFYILLVVVPQYGTIRFYWKLPVALWRKFYFVWSIAIGFFSSNEPLNILYILLVSLLLAVNLAAFFYFFRSIHKGFDKKTIGAGLGGGFFALLGAGCASCGTFIATYVLGVIGAQGLLFWLPFGGKEFGVIGILGLFFSLCMICRKVAD